MATHEGYYLRMWKGAIDIKQLSAYEYIEEYGSETFIVDEPFDCQDSAWQAYFDLCAGRTTVAALRTALVQARKQPAITPGRCSRCNNQVRLGNE